MNPTIDASQWQLGTQVKSLEDDVIGSVIEVKKTAVWILWEDGKTSSIGKLSNIAGRFEKVC